MAKGPFLVVMLTYNDKTVGNAYQVFETCKNSKAVYWGMKEEGIPKSQMIELYSMMKKCGKTTVLEVVAYTEKECMDGAQLAEECGCDILMGTVFFDSVNDFCREKGIRYMPFAGNVKERPSVLEGDIDDIIASARAYAQKGVFGFDLLGYRHTGDSEELIRRFVAEIDLPVCIAGSIDCFSKLDTVSASGAWAFTVGGAFFDKKFGDEISSQIDAVCDYMESKECAYV